MEWKTDKRKIDDLLPAGYNPRQLSETQKELLKESVNKFNLADPIIINANNTIIGGHQRIKVLKELGFVEIDVRIPDRELTVEEEKELNLRLNKNTGEWDFGLLAAMDEDLLKTVGFDDDELKKIFDVAPAPGENDNSVPAPRETGIKRGDMFQLGEHRLLCGDATIHDDVENLMQGDKADMVFTDPPYNVSVGTIEHEKFKVRPIENDNMSSEDFKTFCAAFVANIKAFCDNCIYVCHSPSSDGRIMAVELDNVLHCSTTIIWRKDVFVLGRSKYQNIYEPIWFGWNKTGDRFIGERNLNNVWDLDRPKASKLHPTMKPIELIGTALSHSSMREDLILDLFGGSGSTLIACEKTNRRCRMMEITPSYCQVIIDRWEEFTGQKAVKI